MEPLQMSHKGFKAYDIRGIVPDEVNEDLAYRVGVPMRRCTIPKPCASALTFGPVPKKSAKRQPEALWMAAAMYMISVSVARK